MGRPGVVTSTASAASRAERAPPRRSAPRSAIAFSSARRTSLATAPTRGRSSAGRPPMPRRTVVSSPFLPRVRTSSASSSAGLEAAAISACAASRRACRSWVNFARSTAAPLASSRPARSESRAPARSVTRISSVCLEGRDLARSGAGPAERVPFCLPAGRLDQAPRTASTICPKVAPSRTATSARILRSRSMLAFLSPATNAP